MLISSFVVVVVFLSVFIRGKNRAGKDNLFHRPKKKKKAKTTKQKAHTINNRASDTKTFFANSNKPWEKAQ